MSSLSPVVGDKHGSESESLSRTSRQILGGRPLVLAYMAADQKVPETWDDHWLKIRYKDDMSHMGKFIHGQNWAEGNIDQPRASRATNRPQTGWQGARGTFRPTGVVSIAFLF